MERAENAAHKPEPGGSSSWRGDKVGYTRNSRASGAYTARTGLLDSIGAESEAGNPPAQESKTARRSSTATSSATHTPHTTPSSVGRKELQPPPHGSVQR